MNWLKNCFLKNKWVFKLIGLIILILILAFKINFKELILAIASIKLKYLLETTVILSIITVVNPYRWQYILKKLSIHYSFKKLFGFYYLTMLFGAITPARTGEIISRIALLKKNAYPTDKSLVSIIVERVADLFFLLLFVYAGALVFFRFLRLEVFLIIAISLILIILFLILIRKNFSRILLEKFFLIIIPQKFKSNWRVWFKKCLENLKKFCFRDYLVILLLTTLTWAVIFIAMNLLALGWGINTVPFFYLAISVALSNLVSLLPISISGLGTREAVLLGLLSFFNVSPEKIVSFSLSIFLINLIIICVIGLYAWLKEEI